MAFASTLSTKESRSFSIGPLKAEIHTFSVASGDTSGTITAKNLTTVQHVVMDGSLGMTSAPTFSGNAVTLAFADPAATRYGTLILLGV